MLLLVVMNSYSYNLLLYKVVIMCFIGNMVELVRCVGVF